MPLSIGHVDVKLRVPAPARQDAARMAAWFPEALAGEVGAHLGPSLDRAEGVVCIRKLHVRLSLRIGKWDQARIVELWLREFAKQLFTVLSYPADPDGYGIDRSANAADLRARFLISLLKGSAAGSWQFKMFSPLLDLSRGQAAARLLLDGEVAPGEVVARLAERGGLDAVLAVLQEAELEALVRRLAEGHGESGPLQLAEAEKILRVMADLPPAHGIPMDGHRNALRLWARHRELHPRRILHVLRAARHILNRGLEPPDETLPEPARRLIAEVSSARETPAGARVLDLLRELADEPAHPAASAAATWRPSPVAGILLAAPFIERDRWFRAAETPALREAGGMAAFHALLAATALELAGMLPESGLDDPAVSAFAGEQGAISSRALAALTARLGREECTSLSRSLAPEADPAATPPELFRTLADALSLSFGRRIRGFHKSSLASIQRQLLRRPGRILFEPRRLCVVLDAAPYNIAVHFAGADQRVSASAWFGNRDIEFHLEGL